MAVRNQLIDILSEYEAISPDELERVIQLYQKQGGSFTALLLKESLISEDDLFFLMSRRLGIPAIPEERLLHLTLSPEIRRRVPKHLAQHCVLVPLDLDTSCGRLSVAMFDPTDEGVLEKIRGESRVAEIRAYLARRTAILEVIEAIYLEEAELHDTQKLEPLPLLAKDEAKAKRPKNKPDKPVVSTLDPSPLEPKVQLDPSLEEEIAAFSEASTMPSEAPLPPAQENRDKGTLLPLVSNKGPAVRGAKSERSFPLQENGARNLAHPVGVPIMLRGRSLFRQTNSGEENDGAPVTATESKDAERARKAPSASAEKAVKSVKEEPPRRYGEETADFFSEESTGRYAPTPSDFFGEESTGRYAATSSDFFNEEATGRYAKQAFNHPSDEDSLENIEPVAELSPQSPASYLENIVTTQLVLTSEGGPLPSETFQPQRINQNSPPLPHILQLDDFDSLLQELLSSVGVLVSMLQERIKPLGGRYRDYGKLCRLVAREIGLDEISVSRVALAAHLYSLDLALRREVGTHVILDVSIVFGSQPNAPGGLGPSLRSLGAKALSISDEKKSETLGVRLIRLVADFLELRSEAEGASAKGANLDMMAQRLRKEGADPVMVDALVRAVRNGEPSSLRIDS
jgi:hypothetical protein